MVGFWTAALITIGVLIIGALGYFVWLNVVVGPKKRPQEEALIGADKV